MRKPQSTVCLFQLFITVRTHEACTYPYCFYSLADFGVLADQGEIWQRGADRLPAKFHLDRFRCGFTAPET